MVARSLEVAAGGLRHAAEPHALDHPNYLTCWWEWVTGSTPFFWNWPARYVDEVCAGQKYFLVGEFTAFRRPQHEFVFTNNETPNNESFHHK